MILLYRSVLEWLGILVGIFIGILALAIPTDMLFRSLDIGSRPWFSEVVEYGLFTGVFLSAPWVLSINAHVRVDLVLTSVSSRVALCLHLLLDICGFLICAGFIWFGLIGAIDSVEFESMIRRSLVIPEWWLLSVFIFSMALLCCEFALRIYNDVCHLRGRASGMESPR